MDLTETRISSEAVFDGVLLHVRRDEVRLPDGETSGREWIDHPGAAAVVPLFEDGSTILLRQFRYPPRREFLEVPAGKFDRPGEAPEALAARELEEEAGVRAESFVYLGKTYPGIGYSNEVIHLFLAEGLSEGEAGSDDDEFVIPVRMPFEEAVRMARAGEILDGKSCVAILLAQAHLEARSV
ncbi:MAG: NUDIX hydrolase [Bacteroidota bacterium]